jgi:hypothetical protein
MPANPSGIAYGLIRICRYPIFGQSLQDGGELLMFCGLPMDCAAGTIRQYPIGVLIGMITSFLNYLDYNFTT